MSSRAYLAPEPACRPRHHPDDTGLPCPPLAQPWLWLVGGALLFFAVPFVGADAIGLQPDLFYLCYFTIAVVWFAAFLVTYRAELGDLWRANWKWSLVAGAIAGAAVAAIVFSSAGIDHPDGGAGVSRTAGEGSCTAASTR